VLGFAVTGLSVGTGTVGRSVGEGVVLGSSVAACEGLLVVG